MLLSFNEVEGLCHTDSHPILFSEVAALHCCLLARFTAAAERQCC